MLNIIESYRRRNFNSLWRSLGCITLQGVAEIRDAESLIRDVCGTGLEGRQNSCIIEAAIQEYVAPPPLAMESPHAVNASAVS
jgi:hypothetical protein